MRKDVFNEPSEEHESYGVLEISRVTCTPPNPLFGSSIKHGNLIVMQIKKADRRREFQKDFIMGKDTLVEIQMSASQFADAITSLNIGQGTPVTINFVKGDKWDETKRRFREPPPETDFKAQAQGELNDEMKVIGERILELAKDAKEILKRKGSTIKVDEKEKLFNDLMFIVQEIQNNIPFAHHCFTEAVERTVTEARAELDAAYQTARERLGDKALQAHKMDVPLLTDENPKKS